LTRKIDCSPRKQFWADLRYTNSYPWPKKPNDGASLLVNMAQKLSRAQF